MLATKKELGSDIHIYLPTYNSHLRMSAPFNLQKNGNQDEILTGVLLTKHKMFLSHFPTNEIYNVVAWLNSLVMMRLP